MSPLLKLLLLSLLAGCAAPLPYGGANCRAVAVGTSTDSLEALSGLSAAPEQAFSTAEPFIAAETDVACCARNVMASVSCAHAVDCAALRSTLRVGHLDGKFVGEDCGLDGRSSFCAVYVNPENRVVGVQTFCAD